jgi:hypothetical protein
MIAYSNESQPAFAAFYKKYNDIDIYVEDVTLVGVYERVFSKILDGIAQIISVTPLGNRDAVLNEARRLRTDRTRKRFFLMDGDFHWLFSPQPRIRNLYSLNCYCFENLAFEHASVLNIAMTLAPQKTSAEVRNDFSEDKLLSIAEMMVPLFEIYAAAHLLKSQFTTVAYAPERLLHPRPNYLPDSNAIRNRIRYVYIHLRLYFTRAEILAARAKVSTALALYPDRSKFVSGKYLLAVLLRWFQTATEFRGKQSQLISLLLSVSTLNIDPNLSVALRRVAQRRA